MGSFCQEVYMTILGKIVAGIILGPIAILVVGIGGCEARKAYYDWQVRQMCEKDGGATVYERMAISPELFEKMKGVADAVLVPDESADKKEIPVYWRRKDQTIREGHPSISRMESMIVRRSDGKILGAVVYYGRGGGDFPFTVSHPSSFLCPRGADLERKTFIVEGATK